MAVKANATSYDWQLSFFNTGGELVGDGRFSYDDSMSNNYYLYDEFDFEEEPFEGRYYPLTSEEGVRINSGLDTLEAVMYLPDGRFVSSPIDWSRESKNYWEGEQAYFSLDYIYGDNQESDLWIDDELSIKENVWSTGIVGPGSIFDVGYGYFTEAYENPDQWVIPWDYELSEVTEDLIMQEFQRLDDGVWRGSWQMGDGYEFGWASYEYKNYENDGYWIAELESMTVSSVPIPAALSLFLSGLGLVGLSRVNKGKSST